MKSSNRFALLATVVVALSSLSTAAFSATAPGNASATVITPITITTGATLNFGSFAPSPTGPGTVIVTAANARSATGGIILPPASSGANGTFTIGGAAGMSYSISAPATFSVALTGAPSMVVTLSGIGTTGALVGTTQSYPFGGTLAVASSATQLPGIYTGSFSMIVEYN